jgi:DMSO/TMAO reductase YedYZ molybdopterin-dependent catalytic subunit
MKSVQPLPEASYTLLYSLADGSDAGRHYDVHKVSNMLHELTIIAYEMNGKPVSESNWVPTRGGLFEVPFRLDGPDKSFFQ